MPQGRLFPLGCVIAPEGRAAVLAGPGAIATLRARSDMSRLTEPPVYTYTSIPVYRYTRLADQKL